MPRKPSARKPAKSPKAFDPEGLLAGLDLEMLQSLSQALAGEDQSDPLELFEQLLAVLDTDGELEPAPPDDLLMELIPALTQLSIDENGGDRQARELRAGILERLDDALGSLDPAGLVLIAKIFHDSGWSVPDRLRAQVVAKLDASGAPAASGPFELRDALKDIAEGAEDDPFIAYDALDSVLAAFPSEIGARMVASLGQERAPALLQTLAGFAMHRDNLLAAAAIEELKRAAKGAPVESALIERLVRMRPWLAVERQGPLDEAIRALRTNASPPVDRPKPDISKSYVLACDGSGAAGALASLKGPEGWSLVSLMTKPKGVADSLMLELSSKREAEDTVRMMRQSVMAAKTDAAGIGRYLQLALGENVAAGAPPPFRLIGFVESLGLGPLAPRVLSPGHLIEEILAEAGAKVPQLAQAHELVLDAMESQSWFEAGEAVERLLESQRGPKARVKAVMSVYLPTRRAFWARSCAMTAFALQLDRKAFGPLGAAFALVGREIASGAPLDKIPLMQCVADVTVAAFMSRR